nr:hypothetical protein [Tanacetum cinerariifolium]
EAERAKRQGIILEKEQVKKQILSEEAPESKTPTEEVSKERIKEMLQLWSASCDGKRQGNLYASRKGLPTQKRVSTCYD